MAAIDFNMFHTSFMVDFLQRCEGISEEQRVEIATNYKPDEVNYKLFFSAIVKILPAILGP